MVVVVAAAPAYRSPPIVAVAFLALVLFLLARVLRGTVFGGIVRGLSILLGLACVAGILAVLLFTPEVAGTFEVLLPVVTVTLVVIFQPEIRRALLRFGEPAAPAVVLAPPAALDEAARAVELLARERRGAILVWERSVGLGELVQTGTPLDAAVRAETIVSLFAPGSMLHDGALVLRGGRIAAAGCVLPLGEGAVPPPAGLRHRAALGLSEQTDALVAVVSEETGAVSVAREGRLVTLESPARLREVLRATLETPGGGTPGRA